MSISHPVKEVGGKTRAPERILLPTYRLYLVVAPEIFTRFQRKRKGICLEREGPFYGKWLWISRVIIFEHNMQTVWEKKPKQGVSCASFPRQHPSSPMITFPFWLCSPLSAQWHSSWWSWKKPHPSLAHGLVWDVGLNPWGKETTDPRLPGLGVD